MAQTTAPLPLNLILYGPPGTGKTHHLTSELMPRLVGQAADQSEKLATFAGELKWWQVLAIALWEQPEQPVPALLKHPLVRQKFALTDIQHESPRLWSTLQTHTVADCAEVKYANRVSPLIFSKSPDSRWTVVQHELLRQDGSFQELYDAYMALMRSTDHPEVKRYKFITFHQSFAYEDFVEGIKPVMAEGDEQPGLGYQVVPGVFLEICARAVADPEHPYALFIDEINRGNVAAIFGELITLIEPDKRAGAANEVRLELPYSRRQFAVPRNLHIIGTMNTADRSVEALDTALRRRFAFRECMPRPEVLAGMVVGGVALDLLLGTLNRRIAQLLSRDYMIGHAYFMNLPEADPARTVALKTVWFQSVLPLLQEYFYGHLERVALVIGEAFLEIGEMDAPRLFAKTGKLAAYLDAAELAEAKPVVHLKMEMSEAEFLEALAAIV